MPPGALTTLRRIFRIRVPSHPSFGRLRRFLRRRERGPGTPPRPASPEGDDNSSQHSPPSSTHSIRSLGQGPPFLDNSAADTSDVVVAAEEYNSDQSYASTSTARNPSPSPPLSAITSESFAIRGLHGLSSPGWAVSSGIHIETRHSFSAGGSPLSTVDPLYPSTPTSLADPWIPPPIPDLQAPSTLGSGPLISTYPPPEQIVDDIPLLTCPGAPRRGFRSLSPTPPIPPRPLTPPDHDDEPINEPDDYEAAYQSSSSSGDGSYRTAPQCPSPQQEYESERDPELCVPSTIISDHFKPSKLVINQDISLADMRSVLSALRHSLQDLTIGPAGINRPASQPPVTEVIDLPHLTFFKVDRVDYSVLKELLSSVKMGNLRALDLQVRVDLPEVTPHELDIEWSQLTDVILHGDYSPEVLDKVMTSLHDVNQLKWSGKLVKANHNKYSYRLDALRDLSVCSNEDGCSFFLQNLGSATLQALYLSDFTPLLDSSDLLGVEELSIGNEIDANQFLLILRHFPELKTAEFVVGGITATEELEYGHIPRTHFARLTSLTLHSVSVPIRPLLMTIPLSALRSLQITFSSKAAANHQFCWGIADCLRKEDIPLETLHLVDANLSHEELRSCLKAVNPTLADYRVRRTQLPGDKLGL